jgi:hypothetical protein
MLTCVLWYAAYPLSLRHIEEIMTQERGTFVDQSFFTAPVWEHVLALVAGIVLAPGKRTLSAALRVMGLGAGTISHSTTMCSTGRDGIMAPTRYATRRKIPKAQLRI